MNSDVKDSEEQRAFRAGIDDCGNNIAFFDSIPRRRYESSKSIFILTLNK